MVEEVSFPRFVGTAILAMLKFRLPRWQSRETSLPIIIVIIIIIIIIIIIYKIDNFIKKTIKILFTINSLKKKKKLFFL